MGTYWRITSIRRRPLAARRAVTVALCIAILPTGLAACGGKNSAMPTTSTLAPQQLDGLLLSAQDVDGIMGTRGIEAAPVSQSMQNPKDPSDPRCRGVINAAAAPVYQGSDVVAVRYQRLSQLDQSLYYTVVEQAVVSFKSTDAARAFMKSSGQNATACAGKNVTFSDGNRAGQASIAEASVGDTKIAQKMSVDGSPCQHALSTVSNLVVDVSVCQGHGDEASQIADKIAAKAGG